MATLRALHVQKQVALRKPQDEKKAPPAEAYDAGAMQGVRSEHKTLPLPCPLARAHSDARRRW